MSKQDKKERIKFRDWLAVHAHFRRSGPLTDKKKKSDKDSCRNWKVKKDRADEN